MKFYLVAVSITIFLEQTVLGNEQSSTCIPSLTRPGRPLPCSSNLDCECFTSATDPVGICAAALISCATLNRCDLNNQTCSIPNTVCVLNSRCNQPVCYPVALASPQVCPSLSVSTFAPLTTPLTTTLSNQIKTTYQIFGLFDTVKITGTNFFLRLIQLLQSNSLPYLEILGQTNASSPISINNVTQTIVLSNLNNINVNLYFKTLKQVIYDDTFYRMGTIDIQNVDVTNITLGSGQQSTISATNAINIYPGCCGITNVSSLTNINVTLVNGGWPNVTATAENVNIQQAQGGGVPIINVKARNTANIVASGIPTYYIEAGNFINISTSGISTVYAKASTSNLIANMILNGISKVFMGVSNVNGTQTGYSCPKTVNINIDPASNVYTCANDKINVNGYGGYVYYQGTINDTRTYGYKYPF